MTQEHDEAEALPETEADAESPDPKATGPATSLPRPLQEHLGQQLRAAYQLAADKPAFLGDPAIPAEFDRHLQRLETREKAHERGIEAVKAALNLDDEDLEERKGPKHGG